MINSRTGVGQREKVITKKLIEYSHRPWSLRIFPYIV